MGSLGIIRVGKTPVRFYRPPISPDFAWVALPDLLRASGFAQPGDLPSAHAILLGETRTVDDEGERVEIIPHLLGMGVASAGVIRRGLPVDEAYSTANAEATKIMFIGMSEEERHSFIGTALAYNQRLVDIGPGTPIKGSDSSIAKRVKRFLSGLTAHFRRVG